MPGTNKPERTIVIDSVKIVNGEWRVALKTEEGTVVVGSRVVKISGRNLASQVACVLTTGLKDHCSNIGAIREMCDSAQAEALQADKDYVAEVAKVMLGAG